MTSPGFESTTHPHRRWNPLLREWVLVSPHRAQRPWDGQHEPGAESSLPEYDPSCYLCPGNTRANGQQNPSYEKTFVFENDFAALRMDTPDVGVKDECHGLVRTLPERGLCRVICFSPHHDVTLAGMSPEQIAAVIQVWREQVEDIAANDELRTVTIFENRGAIMGCSNPHPHGQLWANASVPTLQEKELAAQADYHSVHNRPMLTDYVQWELEQETRILFRNETFVALVPHWAVWPFETLVLPIRPMASLADLSEPECRDWAEILKQLLVQYDNLFQVSFPYSMGIHQCPVDGKHYPGVQLHQHFFPPLLRSATVKKFQVGYEMAAEPQRDLTPEQAAQRLREA